MEWKNVHLRYSDLKNGELCLCKLGDYYYNKTGYVVGIYWGGQFYDSACKEDDILDSDWFLLADGDESIVEEYCSIGENVDNLEVQW